MSIIGALWVIDSACSTSAGADGPGQLHREWILRGWERREMDGCFVFAERFRHLYSGCDDLHLYDSYDPRHRVARSAAEYGSFREGPFNALKSARHAVTDGPDVLSGGNLAATTLEFVARLERPDGEVSSIRARSALVWRCEEGTWRIVREQNAVRNVPHGEVEAALREQG